MHLRHALALHEDRKSYQPEYYGGETLPDEHSLVQAWFLGAHIDMGGSAAEDGLSLYPLQWVLAESSSQGLALEFDGTFGNRAPIDDPLQITFPSGLVASNLHYLEAENGIRTPMQDIRRIHEDDRYRKRYSMLITRSNRFWMPKRARTPFDKNGTLKGYCGDGQSG